MKRFIPKNLDIDVLLKNNPPNTISNFKRDFLIHILHLIVSIPAKNKGLQIQNGFVPISSTILQRKVRNYRQYLDYLLKNHVIQTDNHYRKGKKSIGYRFFPQFSKGIKEVEIEKDLSPSRVVKADRHLDQNLEKYGYLFKWYNQNLQINSELAMQFIAEDFERRISKESTYEQTNLVGDPHRQFSASELNINKIAAGDFSLSIDKSVHRLHSTLSNLRSALRNCLTYNGLTLVSIDIKNCQPFLSTHLLNPFFWETKDSKYNKSRLLFINELSKELLLNIFNSTSLYSFIMLCKRYKRSNYSDFHKYRKIVNEGTLYEFLTEKFSELGIHYVDRKSVKAAVFQILFTDNRFLGQKDAQPKRLFKNIFPNVYEIFSLIKRKNKTSLPRLLQRMESYLVLETITKRISEIYPEIPLFTIHDSIITTKGYENEVKEMINFGMIEKIGFAPKLSLEIWQQENLKFTDGTFFRRCEANAA